MVPPPHAQQSVPATRVPATSKSPHLSVFEEYQAQFCELEPRLAPPVSSLVHVPAKLYVSELVYDENVIGT